MTGIAACRNLSARSTHSAPIMAYTEFYLDPRLSAGIPYPTVSNIARVDEIGAVMHERLVRARDEVLNGRPIVLAFTGTSGAIIASSIVRRDPEGYGIAQVRKANEVCHRDTVEFAGCSAYHICAGHYAVVFVDDFICGGRTLAYVEEKVRLATRGATIEGICVGQRAPMSALKLDLGRDWRENTREAARPPYGLTHDPIAGRGYYVPRFVICGD